MEALSIFLRKGGVEVILQIWVDTSKKKLSNLLYFVSQSFHIKAVFFELFPNHFETPLSSFTEDVLAVSEIWVIFVETVVGQMNVWIAEILFSRLLIVFGAKSG